MICSRSAGLRGRNSLAVSEVQATTPECPLWVNSGRERPLRITAALPPTTDVNSGKADVGKSMRGLHPLVDVRRDDAGSIISSNCPIYGYYWDSSTILSNVRESVIPTENTQQDSCKSGVCRRLRCDLRRAFAQLFVPQPPARGRAERRG